MFLPVCCAVMLSVYLFSHADDFLLRKKWLLYIYYIIPVGELKFFPYCFRWRMISVWHCDTALLFGVVYTDQKQPYFRQFCWVFLNMIISVERCSFEQRNDSNI